MAKNKLGRPPKDIAPIIKKVEEYASGAWRDRGDAVPSVVGASVHAGVTRGMLIRYAKTRPGLRYTLDRIVNEQRLTLVNKGLTGEFNAAVCKLMLSNNHGFVEKKEKTLMKKSKIQVVRKVVKASGPPGEED